MLYTHFRNPLDVIYRNMLSFMGDVMENELPQEITVTITSDRKPLNIAECVVYKKPMVVKRAAPQDNSLQTNVAHYVFHAKHPIKMQHEEDAEVAHEKEHIFNHLEKVEEKMTSTRCKDNNAGVTLNGKADTTIDEVNSHRKCPVVECSRVDLINKIKKMLLQYARKARPGECPVLVYHKDLGLLVEPWLSRLEYPPAAMIYRLPNFPQKQKLSPQEKGAWVTYCLEELYKRGTLGMLYSALGYDENIVWLCDDIDVIISDLFTCNGGESVAEEE